MDDRKALNLDAEKSWLDAPPLRRGLAWRGALLLDPAGWRRSGRAASQRLAALAARLGPGPTASRRLRDLAARLRPDDAVRRRLRALTRLGAAPPLPRRQGFLDFAALRRERANDWLVAPRDFAAAKPDAAAPYFAVPATRLSAMWCAVVEEEPRTAITAVSDDRLRIEATQASPVFRFVDDISAWCLPDGARGSSLVVYSRARSGHWDAGVNRRRVKRWLHRLEEWVSATI